jgi:integrase
VLPTPLARDWHAPANPTRPLSSRTAGSLPDRLIRLLPTPQATDEHGGRPPRQRLARRRQVNLRDVATELPPIPAPRPAESARSAASVVRLLPTPAAGNPNDGEDPARWLRRRARQQARAINGNGMGMPLSVAIRLLPTLIHLPADGWREILLTNSVPRSGTAWTDTGASRERRELTHRAAGDTRPVPAHPRLVQILRTHLERFSTPAGAQLFLGSHGGLIDESTYYPIWAKARQIALTPAEARSALARRPYDLRHAAVSTWLNAGVPAAQVAEWAGHSVAVLLRVYAKCVAGQDAAAERRIETLMAEQEAPDSCA